MLSLIALAAVVFHHALAVVAGTSLWEDQYSQALVVPPITILLLYMERKTIFHKIGYNVAGVILYFVFISAFFVIVLHGTALDSSTLISLSIFLFSACCIVAFLFSYGSEAFRLASFPLFFLLLMTPWPEVVRNRVISFLQHGSALATDGFFSIAHIPFSREDVVITLPSVTIEIARECSGIRSTLILFLAALVLAHLFLRSGWSKVALIIFLIPVTIARNGLRIFVLSTLGMYVDESFLTGRLHHNGGIVFFILAFIVLWAMIWILQKFEGKMLGKGIQSTAQNVAVSES